MHGTEKITDKTAGVTRSNSSSGNGSVRMVNIYLALVLF